MQFTPGITAQAVMLVIWAIATVYLINRGGRNNGIFTIVVQSGFRLILLGAGTAAIVSAVGASEHKVFTDAAVQFILVLSAGIGGSYIAHANMSLRDFPNKSDGPEMLAGLKSKKPESLHAKNDCNTKSKGRRENKR